MSMPRHKRPELGRSEPIRHFSGVFGSPPNRGSANESPVSGAPVLPMDAVARGVSMGYRVIEQYMRQGQSFAQAGWPSRSSGGSVALDPQRLAERMFQYTSDLAGIWLEYAQAMRWVSPPTSPSPSTSPSAPAAPHVGAFDIAPRRDVANEATHPVDVGRASMTPPRVSIDVVSSKRVELAVDLKGGAAGRCLRVFDLRAADPAMPRISAVTIEGHPQDDRVVVRLVVPEGQPAGVFTGVVVDSESNLPFGTLSVRVFDPMDG